MKKNGLPGFIIKYIMWTKLRNVVTFAVGLAGGVYAGEHLPDIYYLQIR